MGKVHVTVRDSNGSPVSGASVTIDQTRHAFRHGTCVDASVLSGVEKDEPYREVLEGQRGAGAGGEPLFNTAVFEGSMKWPPWVTPSVQKEALEAFAWLRERGYYVRMHNLVWPGAQTGHLPEYILQEVANGTEHGVVEG